MNDEKIRENINDVLNSQLDGMLYCDRVWTAWSYGTMSEDDFSNIVEDEDFMEETIDAIMAVITESRPTIRTDNSKVIAKLEEENERYHDMVEKLWGIIDDIDTSSDMAKDDNSLYRSCVERRQKERWETGITCPDGLRLVMPWEKALKGKDHD